MRTLAAPEIDLTTPAAHELLRRVMLWIANEPAPQIEDDVATLTGLAGTETYRRSFGAVGQAFSELVNLRVAGGVFSDDDRIALNGLALSMLSRIEAGA